MKLNEITDPRLKARIMDALAAAGQLKRDVVADGAQATSPTKGKRIRQSAKPLMNKLEEEYYYKFLCDKVNGLDQLCSPQIVCIQSIRFRLGNGIWYKPDFFLPDHDDGIEVKGPHSFRGGFENLKVAAHQYPWIKWVLVWKVDGQWQEQTVLP